jgi:hypothetical protein
MPNFKIIVILIFVNYCITYNCVGGLWVGGGSDPVEGVEPLEGGMGIGHSSSYKDDRLSDFEKLKLKAG